MKGFKKLALVAAISAAPFAQAELTSIDDAALSDMTGQAGISIDLSAQVSIGSVEYTDTDGLGGGAGSLAINTIVLGGDGGGALDGIKIDIDVDATAGLVIHLGATNTADVLSGGAQRVDFGLTVGDVVLNNSATLASGISIGGNIGPVDVVIANDGVIAVDAYFEVTSGSLDIDVLGVGVTNLTIGDNNAPLLSSTVYGAGISSAQDYAEATLSAADKLTAEGTPDYAFLQTPAGGSLTPAEALSAVVRGGAVAGVSNMAYVAMTIDTVSTGYLDTSNFTTVGVNKALRVVIDDMSMDIGMNVSIGTSLAFEADGTTAILEADGITQVVNDRSLGSVAINDLNLAGTSLVIYGH